MSAFTKDFTFDSLSRIGDDSCGLSERNLQNVSQSNYLLTNFFSQDCAMKRPIEFATTQPNINYTGGYQVGSVYVFINAVQQVSNSFTATNGNLIVLSQPSTLGDVIKVAYSMPVLNVNIFDYNAMIMGIVLGT